MQTRAALAGRNPFGMLATALAGSVALVIVLAIALSAAPAFSQWTLEMTEVRMQFALWSVFSLCILAIALK